MVTKRQRKKKVPESPYVWSFWRRITNPIDLMIITFWLGIALAIVIVGLWKLYGGV